MNNLDDWEFGENLELKVRPREVETVSITMPKETLVSLRKIANQREMSLEALLKFYVGKGLRQDLRQTSHIHPS